MDSTNTTDQSVSSQPIKRHPRSLVERLRDTPNWSRESFENWKTATSVYDTAPFEAAVELERAWAARDAAVADLEAHIAADDRPVRRLANKGTTGGAMGMTDEWKLVLEREHQQMRMALRGLVDLCDRVDLDARTPIFEGCRQMAAARAALLAAEGDA